MDTKQAIQKRCIAFVNIQGIGADTWRNNTGFDIYDMEAYTLEGVVNILVAFPKINGRWLLTGNGHIFNKSHVNVEHIHTDKQIIAGDVTKNYYDNDKRGKLKMYLAIIGINIIFSAITILVIYLMFKQ